MPTPAPGYASRPERTPTVHVRSRSALIRTTAVLLLFLAVALCLFTAWILIPAPTEGTLVLGVVTPEWSPYLGLLALTVALVSGAMRQGRLGLIVAALAGLAVVFTLPAIGPYPGMVTDADTQLGALPGDRGWTISPYDPLAQTGPYGVSIEDAIPVPLRDGTTTLSLDLYRPMSPGRHPAVVVIYGGAWRWGSPSDSRPLGIDLARAGYVVVMPDYRHSPQYRSPAQVEDVQDALAALATHHDDWGVDPERVALLGRSAGAQIALVLASTPQPVHVAAAIGLYAPIDLVDGYENPPEPDPTNVRGILTDFLGGPPDAAHLAAYRAASPISYVANLKAPTLLMVGSSDELVMPRFQQEEAAALISHGTPTVALEIPQANHAFDAVPFGRGLTFERAVILRFLQATLNR